jgi:glycosyltransferase involved in cell wall biosynthesis
MRILHVIHCLRLGGLEYVVLALATRGRAHGLVSGVAAFGADGPLRGLLEKSAVPVHWVGDVPGLRPATIAGLAGAARRFGADVVHAHDLGPWLNVSAGLPFAGGAVAVATIHDSRPPQGRKRIAAAAAARMARAVVACGGEVRRSLAGWAGKNVVTIENGIEVGPLPSAEERARARARLGIPEEALVVGYLGRLSPEKGPDVLVDAFGEAYGHRGDAVLVLVGTGPSEDEIRARAAGRPNVHVLGVVVDGRDLLAAFDVYVQPSLTEGRSLSMLEAMAAGLPTISTQLRPIEEVHRDGVTALLVPPGDRRALATALTSLGQDAPLRARLGAAARSAVQAYSADRMVEEYAALYRSVRRGARHDAVVAT